MEHRALVHLLCVLGVFHKGLTDLIRTQPTVMAAVGDEALLNCELLQSKDVVQVIWWKILPNGMKALISQHKKYGQDVNHAFRDKVEFTDAGLQSSSIIIRNVTEQDEGCYCCLFNIDPGDDLNATTCLQLFVRVLSGPQKESADGSAWIIIIVIIIVVCVAAFVYGAVLLIRKPWNSSHRDPEKITTPQKPNNNTQENKTPLMQKVNELMRRRTSTGKKRKTDSPTVSSSTTGTNQQLSGNKTPSMKEDNEKVRLTSTVKKTERDSAKLSSSTRGINRQLFPPKSTI